MKAKRLTSVSLASNVTSIHSADQHHLIESFLRLAEIAARGDIIGAGYTVIDTNGGTHEGLLGSARTNHVLAHYGATRLASRLLWRDEMEAVE